MSTASTMLVQEDITWVDENPPVANRSTPGDLGIVLSVGEKWFAAAGEGVILIDGPVHERMGFPVARPKSDRRMDAPLSAIRSGGWKVGKVGPWMTFHATGKPSIHVGLMGWLSEDNHALYDADDPGAMVYRMARFAELTGGCYHGSPGVAGTALLRSVWKGSTPRWVPDWERIAPAAATTEKRYEWKAPTPGTLPYVHQFDANLQYLGAMNVSEVALDELGHTGLRRFDPKAAGYWKITIPAWNDDRLPHPCNSAAGTRTWVTTPTMRLLAELQSAGRIEMPSVEDSWTTLRTARIFRGWAERISGALKVVTDPEAEPVEADRDALKLTLKRTYSETWGLFYRPGGWIHRPDWHHAVTAQARCNMFRKILAAADAGRFPERIHADAVSYGSDVADAHSAVPSGFQIRAGAGGWKVEHAETREAREARLAAEARARRAPRSGRRAA